MSHRCSLELPPRHNIPVCIAFWPLLTKTAEKAIPRCAWEENRKSGDFQTVWPVKGQGEMVVQSGLMAEETRDFLSLALALREII